MPTYKITAPDGRVLKITGDNPLSEQELNEIFAKVGENAPAGTSPTGAETPKRGIDLTPSGLIEKGANVAASALLTPIEMIRSKESNPVNAYKNVYNQNIENMQRAKEQSPILSGIADFAQDMAGYAALPVLRGGGIGNFIGNAAIQGGVPGALEGLKEGENPLQSAGTGMGIAGGINALLLGVPKVGRGIKGFIDNPEVQNKVTKGLEVLTSVPQEYSQRALDAELGGNSLFKGKFDEKTAYRPIEEKLRTAKSLLPSSEDYADEFYKLGQKAKTGIENIKEAAGQEISDMLGNLQATPVNISGLKNSIDSLVKSYARGGNINPAEIRAGRDLELVRDMLGIKDAEQVTKQLNNYYNTNNIFSNSNTELNKEAQNIAFDILAQATKKDKRWLKSQLNANMPKMSTQKRQEFIQELLDSADDRIESIDPMWRNYFPELTLENTQGGKGDVIARQMFDRIMGKDFSTTENIVSPTEQAINDAGKQYNNLLYNLTKNPDKSNINSSYKQFNKIINNLDDDSKELFTEQYANDLDNIQNIVNPQIKPIDLHNAKEILYDMANYDTAGGTRNDVLKSVANQINNFIRTKYPKYKAPNDRFSMIKTLENDLGGINSSTIANKLANYGSARNIASGLDLKLKNINNILPQENRFINDTKNLVDSQNEVNNINKLINPSYERNPRLLSNINDTAREEALESLQNMTGVNFMDELNDIRARETLEKLFPGQGGGSGSSQGFGNLLRTALIGGAPTAAAITGNPTALLGLAAISPKIMAQGTIRNLGRIYRGLGQQVPEAVQRLLNPLAVRMTTPMLYGGISND